VKVTDKTYDTYIIDFNNDNNPEVTIPNGNNAIAQHDYGAPGAFTIAVRGKNVNAANNCKILTENYQTLAVLPQPSINVMTAVDANNLKLDMTTAPHIQYKLEIAINNGGTFQVYKDLYQVNTITVPNLLVDNNFYCFRLSAFDPCAGTNLYSNTICSQDFDVNFLNGVNDLTWKTSTGGITSVTVMRNNTNYSTIPGAPLGFQDSDYNCNEDYCYQIIANYNNGIKSTSLTKCGTGKLVTTFPAINNITSIVRAGAELSYTTDPTIKVKAYDIMKSMFGQPFTFYAQTPDQLYIDASYDYAGGTCYQVNYGDFCNNRSAPGISACPISLSGVMDDKNAITLTWNKYTGYNLGVATYQVSKYNKTGGLIGVYPTTDTTFFDYDPADNEQVVIYTITAVANEPGILKSISNNITMEKPVKLLLPTAFTPNGDSNNPLFAISGKFVSKMSISIFDRWGVLVFTSDKNEPWDGTKAGRPMPESAYVWKAEVVDFAGNTFTKEGTVLLLRPPR
jgi:gliding motility-associated-like protein